MSSRRFPVHPEKRHDAIRAKVAAANAKVIGSGWRWPYGWLVILREPNGTTHKRAGCTYEEAKEIRDLEMCDGRYEVSWIEMRTGAPRR